MLNINFLPWRKRDERRRIKQFLKNLLLSCAATCLLLFISWGYLRNVAHQQRLGMGYLTEILQENALLKKENRLNQAETDNLKRWQGAEANHQMNISIFEILVQAERRGISLTQIQRIDRQLLLQGVAQDEASWREFEMRLTQSAWIDRIKLLSLKAVLGGVDFNVEIILHGRDV